MPNFYEALGLQHDASLDTIISAFHELELAYALNSITITDIAEKIASDESFYTACQAYQTLGHPVWRGQYDAHLINIRSNSPVLVQSQSRDEITEEHVALHAELLKCEDLSDRFSDLIHILANCDEDNKNHTINLTRKQSTLIFVEMVMQYSAWIFFFGRFSFNPMY
ncbi:hypothetical protein GGR57DRAFT_184893 [Xylariaceae sp. FL1272]|nr:hypothetical protein GGR57DRAFT_184893 [Xylariaceae sp. FL1272]